VQTGWEVISESGYSGRALALLHGTYLLTHLDARAGIHAVVYGFSLDEAYGYPAGTVNTRDM